MHACPHCQSQSFKKHGSYWVRHRRCLVVRYFCLVCGHSFSRQTTAPTRYQKKSHMNSLILSLLCEGSSMRAIGRVLSINKNTVMRKFLWLAEQAIKDKGFHSNAREIYLDEQETIIHTKLKPATIALVVDANYNILAAKTGSLPAKGHLKYISLKKYGPRKCESKKAVTLALSQALTRMKEHPTTVKSDSKPSYKNIIKKLLPQAAHKTFTSSRPTLKGRYSKKEFDELFAVNQRCAKLRSDIKRLVRRSWCTTKKIENLQKHLDIYLLYAQGWRPN